VAKHVIMAGWNHVPHLDEKTKATMLAAIPLYQRKARTKGIPQLGAGAIYPVDEEDIIVKPFQIPDHYFRGYGLDVGWNKTAAIFGALDRDTDILYLYSEHYMGEAQPVIHAQGIKARGLWIPGRIDPAARGRGQRDGEQLIIDYKNLGLNVNEAINAVESGIYKVWQRLSTGRLKVFGSMENWLAEIRIYRRDEKGKIVKDFDHAMDATRYLIAECERTSFMKQKPSGKNQAKVIPVDHYI